MPCAALLVLFNEKGGRDWLKALYAIIIYEQIRQNEPIGNVMDEEEGDELEHKHCNMISSSRIQYDLKIGQFKNNGGQFNWEK